MEISSCSCCTSANVVFFFRFPFKKKFMPFVGCIRGDFSAFFVGVEARERDCSFFFCLPFLIFFFRPEDFVLLIRNGDGHDEKNHILGLTTFEIK